MWSTSGRPCFANSLQPSVDDAVANGGIVDLRHGKVDAGFRKEMRQLGIEFIRLGI
jgi:hypothetical protein